MSAPSTTGVSTADAPLPPGSPFHAYFRRGWWRVARWIGLQLSRTLTTLAWLVLIPPFALLARALGDPLARDAQPPRWTPRPPGPQRLDDARTGL